MMLVDKDGERIFCGLEMGLLTKDTIKRLEPDAIAMTQDEFVQYVYETATKRWKGEDTAFLIRLKEMAAAQWLEIQEVYKNAKD